MVDEMQIFIGYEPHQWLPAEVLRWSIQHRTKEKVHFHELRYLPLKLPLKPSQISSLFRFYVPEACSYKGRAIYLNPCTLALTDLSVLYHLAMQGHGALACPIVSAEQKAFLTSVMLLDCSKLKHWNLQEWSSKILNHPNLMHQVVHGLPNELNHKDFGEFPPNWNQMDVYDSSTKIINFAFLATQPWKSEDHPFGQIFVNELQSAIDHNAIPIETVEREIQHGHAHPYLLKFLTSPQ